VAGLGRGVNDRAGFQLGYEACNLSPVADIDLMMLKVSVSVDQPFPVPRRVARRTKKVFPHVIVHSVNLPAGPTKKRHNFASNQTARPGNKHLTHADLIERECGFVKREQFQQFPAQ
jgi:hypothetical protein